MNLKNDILGSSLLAIIKRNPARLESIVARFQNRPLPSVTRSFVWSQTLQKAAILSEDVHSIRLLKTKFAGKLTVGREFPPGERESVLQKANTNMQSLLRKVTWIRRVPDLHNVEEALSKVYQMRCLISGHSQENEAFLALILLVVMEASKVQFPLHDSVFLLELLTKYCLPSAEKTFEISENVMEKVGKQKPELFKHLFKVCAKDGPKSSKLGYSDTILFKQGISKDGLQMVKKSLKSKKSGRIRKSLQAAEEGTTSKRQKTFEDNARPNDIESKEEATCERRVTERPRSDRPEIYRLSKDYSLAFQDPGHFLRKFILEGFVSNFNLNSILFIWDQLMITKWDVKLVENICETLLLLLEKEIFKCRNYEELGNILEHSGKFLFTRHVISVLCHVRKGGLYSNVERMLVMPKHPVKPKVRINFIPIKN